MTELKILSLRSYSGWTQQEGGRRVRVTGDVEVKAEIVCVREREREKVKKIEEGGIGFEDKEREQ